jgi:hypothetical protein
MPGHNQKAQRFTGRRHLASNPHPVRGAAAPTDTVVKWR